MRNGSVADQTRVQIELFQRREIQEFVNVSVLDTRVTKFQRLEGIDFALPARTTTRKRLRLVRLFLGVFSVQWIAPLLRSNSNLHNSRTIRNVQDSESRHSLQSISKRNAANRIAAIQIQLFQG